MLCPGRKKSGMELVRCREHLGLAHQRIEKEHVMIWTIFAILLVLWLFGMIAQYTFGGLIHLLLVIAAIVVVFQLISGRRVV